jgi:hypothetical protein
MAKDRFSKSKLAYRTKTTVKQDNWVTISSQKQLVQSLLERYKDKLSEWDLRFLNSLVKAEYLYTSKQHDIISKISNKFRTNEDSPGRI